jgi:DNA-binding transcriptional LysR family regulator
MPDVHFHALDLNLLRLFDALAEERSVTRAGARLGLTQSAVSHALNRLRHILQDELFIRGPDGMRPTARAEEIAPRVRDGLRQLQQALSPAVFVPSDTQRRFTITAGAYIGTVLMPGVVARLRRAAPAAELRLVFPSPTLGEDLLGGRVEMAIGAFGRSADRFAREPLFTDSMVWALRADHPAAQGERLSLDALAGLAHVITASAEQAQAVEGRIYESGLERRVIWDDGGAFEAVLARRGWRRSIGLTVQDAQSALAIVGRSDMAALVPQRLARALAGQYGLRLFDPPYASPSIEVEALWRRDLSESPPLAWLRSQLRAAAAEL